MVFHAKTAKVREDAMILFLAAAGCFTQRQQRFAKARKNKAKTLAPWFRTLSVTA